MNAGELNLTAMIDIAFQLLSFFIITSHPVDVIATLDVFRPSADPSASSTSTPNMIRVQVLTGGYTINDKVVAIEELDRLLAKLASIDKNQTIMIMCSQASKHADLIGVLDICSKNGLVNLSVVSMK
jgi:biopolymer transport protein ExbD